MSTYNICICEEIIKILTCYFLLLLAIIHKLNIKPKDFIQFLGDSNKDEIHKNAIILWGTDSKQHITIITWFIPWLETHVKIYAYICSKIKRTTY